MTCVDEPDKIRLYSLSFDSTTGALSTDEHDSRSDREAMKNNVPYAAPLCTSRDEYHAFVVYPVENVGFVVCCLTVLAVRSRISVAPCFQAR